MAAKTLHELEIEVERMKIEFSLLISTLRRDVDMMLNVHKPEVTILDSKPNTDGGKDTK